MNGTISRDKALSVMAMVGTSASLWVGIFMIAHASGLFSTSL
ncbi:hypothetical protein [Sphingomonas morindae]|nr:hypothetical protein [Sphingomonas morindae]